MRMPLNRYPQTECDISLSLLGCTTNLQIFPQGSSGSRVQMQGVHYTQATQIADPGLRKIFAGPEKDYANYMFNVVVTHTCTVIRVIHRYARPDVGDQKILETLVFAERVMPEGSRGKKPVIDVIRIPAFIQNHQTFATEVKLTKEGRRLGSRTFLKKGTILAQTNSIIEDEYCIGLQAKTLLVSHPMVIEDSCLISQSLADRMMTYGYKTYRETVGEKDFPLFLYKDKDGNPTMFPAEGEKVREDGILFAKREHDTLLAAVEMSEAALSEPCAHFDKCIIVNPDSVVMDIKVYRDDNRPRRYDPETGEKRPCEKMPTPVGMQEELDTYADANSNFQGLVRDVYKFINEDYRKKGFKTVDYTPDAKQAIMYSIADNPYEVNRNLSRYAKQFGQLRCDDYIIEITVKFPIPMSVSGKLTDTMGGKGITGMILPDDEMPGGVDLLMAENAMLRRTNFNRGFEHYVNASRREQEEHAMMLFRKGEVEDAFDHIFNFTSAVNPEHADAIDKLHPTFEDREDALAAIDAGEDSLRLWVPSDNKYPMDQIMENIYRDFPPKKETIKITMPDGTKVDSKFKFSIGELYIIRLDKWGGEFSAVAAGRFQAFGTIAKQHSGDKHRRPVKETPIKHLGESEGRHQSAYIGGDVCADAHDRSNNPAVADNVVTSILTAEVPSNIEHAVNRVKNPLGHNRAMEINRHVLRCDGIGFTTEK